MIEKLFEIQKILLEQFNQQNFYYARESFHQIQLDNRIIGVVGSRGIGKTTFLLKQVLLANQKNPLALYVSADNIFFLDHRLLEVADTLYKETDVRLLCVDEIHKYPNWAQELKNIVDSYPDMRVIFSGSSAIDIIQGKYDLSRRVTLYELHGFSFREYLEITLQKTLPKISLDELIHHHLKIAQSLDIPQILKHFKEYLRSGYYPFFRILTQEAEKFQAIENVTQKTIYEDIATLRSLKTSTLLTIERLYKYVLQALPGELSVYKLANTLGKDFENTSEYVELLKQAGLIRCLYPNKVGKTFFRNPLKIYPENTNMIYAHYVPQLQDMTLGKSRETFAINQLQNAGITVFYSEEGDFKVNKFLLEIGGKNKTTAQIKNHKNAYLFADGILIGSAQTIPLYLLGFLY